MIRKSKLLGVARSTAEYKPAAEDPEDIRIKRLLDETYLIDPYLGSRRLVTVLGPDHVWCADITYVPMPRGHAYLCAVMDWHSRNVLGWAVSNTMGTGLCLEALEMALGSTGKVPEIFNTDQGCQFTSLEWTGRLTELGVAISMDGKGRWMDNVFIERLWRSVKYEEIYLKEHATIPALQRGLQTWFNRYNNWRPHANLGNLTPAHVYQEPTPIPKAA